MKNSKAFFFKMSLILGLGLLFFGSVVLKVSLAENNVLYWGSSGNEVKKVQAVLNQWGYYKAPIDGYYSFLTQKAVKDFQRQNNLKADGIVGAETWMAMGFPKSGYGTSEKVEASSIGNQDSTYLLAKVIQGEASNESFLGKVAVGAVILNRVESNLFPNSLAGVIYQTHAFESVSNGQYTRQVSDDSLRAARQAMSGWDPTGGALYFWNPNKKVNDWIWSRKTVGQIGNHVFAF